MLTLILAFLYAFCAQAEIECSGHYLGGEKIQISSNSALIKELCPQSNVDYIFLFVRKDGTPDLRICLSEKGQHKTKSSISYDLEWVNRDGSIDPFTKRKLVASWQGNSSFFNVIDSSTLVQVSTDLSCTWPMN